MRPTSNGALPVFCNLANGRRPYRKRAKASPSVVPVAMARKQLVDYAIDHPAGVLANRAEPLRAPAEKGQS